MYAGCIPQYCACLKMFLCYDHILLIAWFFLELLVGNLFFIEFWGFAPLFSRSQCWLEESKIVLIPKSSKFQCSEISQWYVCVIHWAGSSMGICIWLISTFHFGKFSYDLLNFFILPFYVSDFVESRCCIFWSNPLIFLSRDISFFVFCSAFWKTFTPNFSAEFCISTLVHLIFPEFS